VPRLHARLGLIASLVLSFSALGVGTAFADGSEPDGGSLGLVNGVLIFAVAPIGVFLLIALLVMRPGSGSGGARYRPGKEWNNPPTWIGIDAATGATALPALPAGSPAGPAPVPEGPGHAGPGHVGEQGGAGAAW